MNTEVVCMHTNIYFILFSHGATGAGVGKACINYINKLKYIQRCGHSECCQAGFIYIKSCDGHTKMCINTEGVTKGKCWSRVRDHSMVQSRVGNGRAGVWGWGWGLAA
jgi:hypothetical protein